MQNLYRHYDSDGKLLYVGVSLSAVNRLSQHKASHWFHDIARVDIQRFTDRAAALEAERKAIHEENPLHNLSRPTPKEVLARKKSEAEKSRRDLVERLVQFNPMYTINEAANAIGLSADAIKRLISEGKIGYIEIGHRNTAYGVRPLIRISGWQVIDFIEQLQNGEVKI